MNYTCYSRMQADFDKMLLSDIPGQNYDCDLISDVGNGFPKHRSQRSHALAHVWQLHRLQITDLANKPV